MKSEAFNHFVFEIIEENFNTRSVLALQTRPWLTFFENQGVECTSLLPGENVVSRSDVYLLTI